MMISIMKKKEEHVDFSNFAASRTLIKRDVFSLYKKHILEEGDGGDIDITSDIDITKRWDLFSNHVLGRYIAIFHGRKKRELVQVDGIEDTGSEYIHMYRVSKKKLQ